MILLTWNERHSRHVKTIVIENDSMMKRGEWQEVSWTILFDIHNDQDQIEYYVIASW